MNQQEEPCEVSMQSNRRYCIKQETWRIFSSTKNDCNIKCSETGQRDSEASGGRFSIYAFMPYIQK
jgi:hypothetical protein